MSKKHFLYVLLFLLSFGAGCLFMNLMDRQNVVLETIEEEPFEMPY